MNVELNGILQIGIPVRDTDRAIAFYRDRLGLRLLMTGPHMAFFDCGGIRLYLDANPGWVQPGGNSLVYFKTSNIQQQHAQLQEAQVEIYKEPQVIANLPDREIWLMWIRDSEKNLLGLMEERPK